MIKSENNTIEIRNKTRYLIIAIFTCCMGIYVIVNDIKEMKLGEADILGYIFLPLWCVAFFSIGVYFICEFLKKNITQFSKRLFPTANNT